MASDDPGWANALAFALEMIPEYFATLGSGILYTATVYNWAVSLIIQFQQDQEGQVFFANARKAYGVSNWLPGPIDAASDNGTSQHTALGRGMQNLTFSDMQRAKDPYGRTALGYLQQLGSLWGLS